MKVTIDGQSIEVEPGTTILQAARMIGGEVVPPAKTCTKDTGQLSCHGRTC
jgi:predicted molibdopterin-dependent oxidoreductase YjgC